jgi:peptidoglycan L-alanyl-D-glutamate endopeptidase CwlK
MEAVVIVRDISVVCGERNKEDQTRMLDEGKSELPWPLSKHNRTPQRPFVKAVDIVPWPEQYTDPLTMIYVAGIVIGIASELHIPVRWGGDWDKDGDLNDQSFKDLWHFETI